MNSMTLYAYPKIIDKIYNTKLSNELAKLGETGRKLMCVLNLIL